MKLTLVLYVLYLKMRTAIQQNNLFRRRAHARTGSILIKTADNDTGRLFVISKGSVFSKSGSSGDADVIMIWKDAGTAFKAMISNDPLSIAHAMDKGDLHLEGDMSIAQWFSSLTKALKTKKQNVKKEKVAVIGLGKMGSGIAKNIQESGFDLVVYNRTDRKAQSFIDKGAALASSPAEAARISRIVITCLMDDSSVLEIVTADNGILSGMAKGGIHLCATTISPDLADKLTDLHRKHGSYFVTGTVVGRPDAAESGELLTLLAGDKASINQCRSVCSAYSLAALVIGEEPKMANYAKLSANYFAVANMELMGQLYAFGEATGIDNNFLPQMFESSYANPILKMYAKKILNKEFQKNIGFELTGGRKDVNLMLNASKATSHSLDYAPIILSKMDQATKLGWGSHDWSSFTEISRKKSADFDNR